MDKIVKFKLAIITIGLLIISSSIIFYTYLRESYLSFAFLAILITCLSLIFITLFPKKIIDLFFGIEIKNMSMAITKHYHSIIINVIVWFSAILGIGLTLVWSSHGEIWRTINFWFLMILLGYFLLVMYVIFLREFRDHIKSFNKKMRGKNN